jgi:hypothetical protein
MLSNQSVVVDRMSLMDIMEELNLIQTYGTDTNNEARGLYYPPTDGRRA